MKSHLKKTRYCILEGDRSESHLAEKRLHEFS
jgi:hypothetical protein